MWGAKPPGFKDYRTTNDGVMVADIGFKKQLWALDPELDVVWDWASGRWEIWRFPGQKNIPHKIMDHRAKHMMTVQTKDRSFRELGADVLLKLQEGDPWRFSYKELCDYFDRMDDNLNRAREKKLRNLIHDMNAETFHYMKGIRKQVPFAYSIKPSEEKLLLNVPMSKPSNLAIKAQKKNKIANAIGGQYV